MKRTLLLAGLFVVAPGVIRAQPAVQDGRIEAKPFSALPSLIKAGGPLWIGWSTPVLAGDQNICCWSNDDRGCFLEGNRPGRDGVAVRDNRPVPLEGPKEFHILARVEGGALTKIRSFSQSCPLDLGGLTMQWLGTVSGRDSVAFLEPLVKVTGADSRKWKDPVAGGALSAIAQIRDAAADAALDRFTAAAQPEVLRERASFWLGNARGARGVQILQRMLANDPSDHVREKVLFALTQSSEAAAMPLVVAASKNDKSPRVRSQALFWMAQKAGRATGGDISAALAADPDREVRKKAVFALSRMPKDEGVPRLIEVAKSHRDPEVRKQAMFWLGQSKDPRAVQFFEDILLKR